MLCLESNKMNEANQRIKFRRRKNSCKLYFYFYSYFLPSLMCIPVWILTIWHYMTIRRITIVYMHTIDGIMYLTKLHILTFDSFQTDYKCHLGYLLSFFSISCDKMFSHFLCSRCTHGKLLNHCFLINQSKCSLNL